MMLGLGNVAAFPQLRQRRYVEACLVVIGAARLLSVIAVRQPIRRDQRFMIWMVPTLAVLALTFADRPVPDRSYLAMNEGFERLDDAAPHDSVPDRR